MSELSVLAFVALPFVGLLVWSIIEIGTRCHLRAARRVVWLALVVLLPVVGLAIYVVARPPKGAQLSGTRPDVSRAEALVLLAERRQRGELTDDTYEIEVAEIARVDWLVGFVGSIENTVSGIRIKRIGESDCEELGEGWLAQPVNALSSFSYVGIGLVVLAIAVRRGQATVDAWVFAGLLAAVGLGSVAFHGPQPVGARVMHDLPILLVVLHIVASDVQLLRGSPPSRWLLFVPAAALATAVMLVSVDAGPVMTGLAVVALAVVEVIVYRRRIRDLDDRQRRRTALLVIVMAAIAAMTWLLGRTDSPICEPEDVFQLHGLWHLISAMVFGLWWWLATDGGRHDPHERGVVATMTE